MKVVEVWGTTSPMRLLGNTTEERKRLWVRKAKPEKRHAFKGGDKVRVVSNTGIRHFLRIGSEAEVVAVSENDLTLRGIHEHNDTVIRNYVSTKDVEPI